MANYLAQASTSESLFPTNPAKNITEFSLAGILSGGGFSLFDFVFFLVGAFFLGSLIIASFRYIGSEGDPKKIHDATMRMTNSIVGLVIVFASFVIVRLAASIFGFGYLVPVGR